MNDEDKRKTIQELTLAWFKKGDNDLKTAQHCLLLENPPTDTICFHAQQCAEKYLKGFLSFYQKYFPKSHDIEVLVKLCSEIKPEIGIELQDSFLLSDYAVETRYPGDWVEIKRQDAEEAISMAQEVKAVILKKLTGKLA